MVRPQPELKTQQPENCERHRHKEHDRSVDFEAGFFVHAWAVHLGMVASQLIEYGRVLCLCLGGTFSPSLFHTTNLPQKPIGVNVRG